MTPHIRSLDGLAGFLRPPDVRDLVRHADRGPIVVLNVSKYRADAILVRADGVRALPLGGLTFDHVRSQVVVFLRAQATTVDPGASLRARIAAEDELMDLLAWLWDSVVEPRPTAMDRVVSSYTPTVRALAHARRHDA